MEDTAAPPLAVKTSEVKQTKDYSLFKDLKGNRAVDDKHVKRLMNNMLKVGNLTAEFPIVVNENMEVIDGQHRLAACEELNWPICYRIVDGLNLDTVRGINQAAQNWGWKDYAHSFIRNGNDQQKDQYQRFVNLYSHFDGKYSYHTLMLYCGLRQSNYKANSFNTGELMIPNHDRTYRLLKQYQEISNLLDHNTSTFAATMYRIMQEPEYDHERMVHKAKLWDAELKKQGTQEDYARMIETIYNRGMSDENRKRLY